MAKLYDIRASGNYTIDKGAQTERTAQAYVVRYLAPDGTFREQRFNSGADAHAAAKQWAEQNVPDVETGFRVVEKQGTLGGAPARFNVQFADVKTGKWVDAKDGKSVLSWRSRDEAVGFGTKFQFGGPGATKPRATESIDNSPPTPEAIAANDAIAGWSAGRSAEDEGTTPNTTTTSTGGGGLPSIDFLARRLLDGTGPPNFAKTNADAVAAGDATAIAVQKRAIEIAAEQGFFGGPKGQAATPALPGGGTTGGDTGGGDAGTGAGLPALPEQPIAIDARKPDSDELYEYVRAHYGYPAKYLAMPVVGDILRRAAAGRWDETKLAGELSVTDWWKQTSARQRTWDAAMAVDPATQNELINKQINLINSKAKSAGLTITGVLDLGAYGRYNKTYYMAVQSLREGWDETQINRAIFEEGGFDPTKAQRAGVIKSQAYAIKAMAAEYLLPMDDQTANRYAQQILLGEMDQEVFKTILIDQAKMRFPSMEGLIDRGATPSQFFDSYRSTIAKTLEMDINQIDFMDPRWSEVIDYVDPNTGTSRFMTLTEAANWAKQREGWDFTQQAADAAQRAAKGLYWSFDNPQTSSLGAEYARPFAF